MKNLPSNTFADVWKKADRNWKYSKSYYQVNIMAHLNIFKLIFKLFAGTIFE